MSRKLSDGSSERVILALPEAVVAELDQLALQLQGLIPSDERGRSRRITPQDVLRWCVADALPRLRQAPAEALPRIKRPLWRARRSAEDEPV